MIHKDAKKNHRKKTFIEFHTHDCSSCDRPFSYSLSALAYYSAEEDIACRFSYTMDDGARSLIETAVLIDKGLKLHESACEEQLRMSFVPFLAAYESSGGDPAVMDLLAVKDELSSDLGGPV